MITYPCKLDSTFLLQLFFGLRDKTALDNLSLDQFANIGHAHRCTHKNDIFLVQKPPHVLKRASTCQVAHKALKTKVCF